MRMYQDSFLGSFLPSIDIGFGVVADSDILVLFTVIVGLLNYQLKKDWPEDARGLASLFFFVPLQAIDDICSYAFGLTCLAVVASVAPVWLKKAGWLSTVKFGLLIVLLILFYIYDIGCGDLGYCATLVYATNLCRLNVEISS